jgi:YidC/Oxa1 family membrane protein insertase
LDNRRLLLAAVLSMGILLAWQYLFPPPEPVRQPLPPETSLAADATSPVPDPAAAPVAAAALEPDAAAAGEPAPAAEPIVAAAEEVVALENAEVRASFTNRGGQLVSLVIKSKRGTDGEPLELVQRRAAAPWPFALIDGAGVALPINDELFVAERETTTAGEQLVLRYRGAAGSAEKRFLLHPDGRLDLEVSASVPGFGVMVGPGLRSRSAEQLANRFLKRSAVWSVAGTASVETVEEVEETLRIAGAGLDWIGVEDTYFLVAVVPGEGVAGARIEPVLLDAGTEEGVFDARALPAGGEVAKADAKRPRDTRLVLVADNGRLTASSYWGSKQYDRLKELPWGLERTVRWGWLGFLARPMLWGLQWIHANLVANYGWAIVVLTTILKILLLPLSLASFKSMRKMQKLNPRMQAIRERWRSKLRDKQGRFNPEAQKQMNEEVMALYRTEGVNPAGGCLPILVQLPIFFAFYQLLSTAVELWHSPWIGWVKDLTAPDPFYALPIIMGVTQILQQRMTPAPPDPIQKRMIQAMPIVFTVFSLGFPAGLVLYWLTNNVLSIVQQGLYNRFQDRHAVEAAPAAPGRKGRQK